MFGCKDILLQSLPLQRPCDCVHSLATQQGREDLKFSSAPATFFAVSQYKHVRIVRFSHNKETFWSMLNLPNASTHIERQTLVTLLQMRILYILHPKLWSLKSVSRSHKNPGAQNGNWTPIIDHQTVIFCQLHTALPEDEEPWHLIPQSLRPNWPSYIIKQDKHWTPLKIVEISSPTICTKFD